MRARGLDTAIRLQGAEQVLCVEPASNRHHSGADVPQMGPQVAGLPEVVVALVLERLLPETHLILKVFGADVGQRSKVQKELVAVGCSMVERKIKFPRGGWARPAELG